MLITLLSPKLKKRFFRLRFYLTHIIASLKPRFIGQRHYSQMMNRFQSLSQPEQKKLIQRVDYYCKEFTPAIPQYQQIQAADFQLKGHNSSYYFDLAALLPHFDKNSTFAYEFGDVVTVPDCPTIVKSRPITTDNSNSVLLKLDSLRHFYIPQDPHQYNNKKAQLVWRGAAHQPHRIRLLEQYAGNPLFDLGCVAQRSQGKSYHADFLSIDDQLHYQFILSIEGNDVATNLKWIMASNSLCFMTKPRYETWFMEGALLPDYHYVLLQDDYSDLEEKVTYYQNNPEQAMSIIKNAQHHVQQFFNPSQERMVQLLVLTKYLNKVNHYQKEVQ